MRRLRASELDAMARDAFRFRLPRRFRFQPPEPYCGHVSRLQICDALGAPTGLRCRVQITSTDEAGARALVLPLPEPSVQHDAALDPPLLRVRYCTRSGSFYARWAVRWDPPGPAPDGFAQSENAFIWSPCDRWNEDSPGRLERDLRIVRELSAHDFHWPMRFRLEIEDDALPGCARAALASAIRKRLSGLSRYVELVEDGRESHGAVTFSPKSVHAAIGGFYDVTLPPGERGRDGVPAVVAHLPLLIALVLTRAGQAETAARLCELCESGGEVARRGH